MKHRIFDQTDISVGQKSSYSEWVHLPDNYGYHAINGYYDGDGSLAVYYQIAASESDTYVDEDVRITINGIKHDTKTVFHEAVYVLPNEYIRFYAVEEGGLAAINNLVMAFIQKGRSA